MPGEWNCDEWVAIHDHMPGRRPLMIRVEGTCTFPTPGWEAKLNRGNPGSNPDPDTLYLDLDIKEPSNPQIQPVTPERVIFEEEDETEYRVVEINHGDVARIDVQHPQ